MTINSYQRTLRQLYQKLQWSSDGNHASGSKAHDDRLSQWDGLLSTISQFPHPKREREFVRSVLSLANQRMVTGNTKQTVLKLVPRNMALT